MWSIASRKVLHRAALAAGLILLLWLGALVTARADGVVRGFYFYSPDCAHCQAVAAEVLPALQAQMGSRLELRMFDIREPRNNEVLLALEAQYGLAKVGLPEVFIGRDVLVGEEAMRAGLAALIEKYLAEGGVDFPTQDQPAATVAPTAVPTPGDAPLVHVAYFYKPGCGDCDRVAYDLRLLQSRYPSLRVISFDVTEKQPLGWALAQRAGIPVTERLVTPAVFVGNDALVGSEVTLARLEALVERYQEGGAAPVWQDIQTETASQDILGFFRSLGPLAVVGAGLVDGLNPCAFATIVFFISYLAFVGRSRRQIVQVGAAFTLGVFATYLLVGLGALRFIEAFSGIRLIARLVYGLMAALCLVFAGVSVYDAGQAWRGRPDAMQLRLPRFLQRRVHRVIRENSSQPAFVGVAGLTGLVVSLLELACTGQVYLPTLLFVQGEPRLRAHALSYLVLYNLVFVAPLIVVFVLATLGVSSGRLARLVQKHTGSVKLLMAAIFALLGAYLLSMVL